MNGDGRIVLYQPPNRKNPRWECRISVQGSAGYKRFSTLETDQRKAEQMGVEKYEELYFKVKRGGSLTGKPFTTLYLEWTESFGVSPSKYNQVLIGHLKRKAFDFFGRKPIDEITEADLNQFMGSLVGEGDKPYATSTIRQIRTALNLLFKFAKERRLVETVPSITAPSLLRNRRPDFPIQDWRALTDYMRSWVTATTNGLRGKNGLDHKRHRERFYLQHYILILASIRIRIGEMRNCRWLDLDKVEAAAEDERLLSYVDDKNGERGVVANPDVEDFVKPIWDFRAAELGQEPDITEPIFFHPDGKKIGNYKKGFQKLLEESGLRQDKDGNNRTLYLLRHTYATIRINEVPIYQLAVNMGTSVEMIEDYYSHARTKNPVFVATVTKGNQ